MTHGLCIRSLPDCLAQLHVIHALSTLIRVPGPETTYRAAGSLTDFYIKPQDVFLAEPGLITSLPKLKQSNGAMKPTGLAELYDIRELSEGSQTLSQE